MKTKISAYQLFCITILIPNNAMLFFITPEAKQDGWIAMLIYIFPAIILQLVYTSLWNKYPNDTLVTYIPKILGKFIGTAVSILYITYFTYLASRVLRDMSSLIIITKMPKVSLLLVTLVFSIVAAYIVYLGIENLARASHIILPILIIFIVFEWIFLFTTPNALNFCNLKPVLENGILPVITKSWKLITFPFGETLLLSMFYPSVVETSKVRKAAIFGIISLGIILSITTTMFISVLSADFASNSIFPLLQTIQIMHMGESFDRVDIFIILILITTALIKISLFTFGAMLGTAQLTKLKDTKYLAIPFSIVICITSLLIAKNYPQHIYNGLDFTVKYIHIPLQIIVPVILLLVQKIKDDT